MSNKEIKITVPKGYEIDKENSTFECIKFKKKSALSYRQMLTKLAERGDTYLYIDEFGDARPSNQWAYLDILFTIFDERQAKQLFALNKLMNAAAFLNEKTLDWNDVSQKKWCIYYNHTNGDLGLIWHISHQYSNVHFDSEEHAKQAIEILGEDTIKTALGDFE
jgi:hypothetical protein